MYFLAAGSVHIELPGRRIKLEAGAFFGEIALLGDNVRTANVVSVSPVTLLLLDLVAVAILTFALYLPRHRRRDLVVAYIGVNVGVFAVATALGASTVGAGLGLGLFGVLSIIRLRSSELDQHEIAYYFAALAVGLLCGGALANLADRLHAGEVIDFIDFPIWPTFNLADIAIVGGAGALALILLSGADERAESN